MNPGPAQRVTVIPKAFGSGVVVAADLQHPDFIKVDVDGGELEALKAAAPLLRDFPPLVVETHSRELEEECNEFLRSVGYCVEIVPNSRLRAFWPEWRPLDQNRWLLASTLARPESARTSLPVADREP